MAFLINLKKITKNRKRQFKFYLKFYYSTWKIFFRMDLQDGSEEHVAKSLIKVFIQLKENKTMSEKSRKK